MRLICPNCDAQYEVDDSVIPSEGRDVQCSSCGHTWFQKSAAQLEADGETPVDSPKQDAKLTATPETADAADIETADTSETTDHSDGADESDKDSGEEQPAPRKTDESVLGILREEAAREAAARAKDAKGTQKPEPAAGLDLSKTSSDTASENSGSSAPQSDSQSIDGTGASHRDRLPDIDEINSTLRAAPNALGEIAEDEDVQPKGRRGFRLGFSLVLILATLGLLAYIFAPDIVQRFPESEPYMVSYVEQVNNLRDWLDQMMKAATDKMSGTGSN